LMTNNLPSGYFRDYQLIKEIFLPVFGELDNCLNIASFALKNIKLNDHIIEDERYKYVYSVEEVNKLVLKGVPFRDAYRQISEAIVQDKFQPDMIIHHTHEGSISNLCLEKIKIKMNNLVTGFNFKKADDAMEALLKE
jgi:argininosuccinate lyase